MAKTTFNRLLMGLLLLGWSAAPVLAHGWAFPGPIGGANPVFTEARGGGNPLEEEAPEVVAEPLEPFAPAGGLTTEVPAPVAPPRAGTMSSKVPKPSAPGAGGSYGRSAGRATPNRKAKVPHLPWLDRVHFPWKPAFPIAQQGYDAQELDLVAGLTRSVEEGGWGRTSGPSVVLLYDPSQKSHEKALRRIETNGRLRAAAQLFNCFRLDRRSLGRTGGEPQVMIFNDENQLVAEMKGRNVHKIFKHLEKAYETCEGRDLSRAVPVVSGAVNGIAWCDYQTEWMSAKIICPDCGEQRHDVKEAIADMDLRKDRLHRVLEGLRSK